MIRLQLNQRTLTQLGGGGSVHLHCLRLVLRRVETAESALHAIHAPKCLVLASTRHFPSPKVVWSVTLTERLQMPLEYGFALLRIFAASSAVVVRSDGPLANDVSNAIRSEQALHRIDVRSDCRSHLLHNLGLRTRARERTTNVAPVKAPREIKVRIQDGPRLELVAVKPRLHDPTHLPVLNTARIDEIHVQRGYAFLRELTRSSDRLAVEIDCILHPLQHDVLLRRHEMRRLVEQREPFNHVARFVIHGVVPLHHLMDRLSSRLLQICAIPERRLTREHAVISAG